MYPGGFFGRPDKDAMMKDPQLAAGMYGPGAAQTNLYGTGIPAVSGLSGMQGLSGLHQSGNRGMGNNPQLVSRSSTAPGNFVGTNLGNMGQLGAPSPPAAAGRYVAYEQQNESQRNWTGMIPLTSGRTSLMSTGQGLVAPKPRPSNLSSAIGSALPVNTYGGIGRSAQGIMSPISSGYTSAFSETASQPGFDPSEFPLLGLGRSRHDGSQGPMMAATAALGRHGFTGPGQMPVSRSESVPGFQMHSEDFPALPGTSSKGGNVDKIVGGAMTERDSPEVSQENKFPVSTVTSTLPEYRSNLSYDPAPGSNKERSVAAAPIGPPKSSNRKNYQPATVSIPSGMVQDQFGMIGLLTFIRGAETDPSLVALALGSDLTTLGLNLNSPDNLYNTFASPWADSPCRPQDIDWNVPQEYLTYPYIREKLAPIRLNRYQDDLLFYLYYSNGGDIMQVLAAHELYNRDWRYHKDERLWITRAPGMKPTKQESTYEEGTYCYFDVHAWRKAHKEFRVEYDKLEDRPQVPQNIPPGIHHGNQTISSVA